VTSWSHLGLIDLESPVIASMIPTYKSLDSRDFLRKRTTGLEPATFGLGSRAGENYARRRSMTSACKSQQFSLGVERDSL